MSKQHEKSEIKLSDLDISVGDSVNIGCDCGTMNFVSARKINNKVQTTRVRNAFIELPAEHKRMLKLSKTSYVELDNKLLVIGDEAIDTANLFNREARRPMSAGMVSAGELDAQQIMAIMMKRILGEPKQPNEKCCYSVPAPSVDVSGSDTIYHSRIIGKIIQELGYKPEPVNEALAIIFSECSSNDFSGIAISFGSGMTNICMAYNAMSALEFSFGRGGDWIDQNAAKAVGSTSSKVCSLKESNIDISKPKNREEEAISVYIQALIDYSIENIIKHFSKIKSEITIPKPIPIIVSGGTSKAGGFLEKFKERFDFLKSKFPVQISEIKPAHDPLTAVATGLLLLASSDE